MVPAPIRAVILVSSMLAPLLAGCSPVPSKGEDGDKTASAPGREPAEVCTHVRELAAKDSEDAAVLDQVERECVETLTGLRTRYEGFTACVEAASDRAAVVACEAELAKPRSLLAAAGSGAKVEDVCDHVIEMLQRELGQVGSPIADSEVQQLREQCVKDASAQIEVKGVEAFEKEAACILEAQTIEALQACGV